MPATLHTQRMALEHAILTSLAERAASESDLTRRFDATFGFFWTATHQQIYRALVLMEEVGSVVGTVRPRQGRADTKIYELTAEGRRRLADWTTTPSRVEPIRSEFAVKVRAMPFGDRAAVIADIRQKRALHQERLLRYEVDAEVNFGDPAALPDDRFPAYLVLRGGILQEEAYVGWFEEMLELLQARYPESSNP